MVSLSVKNINKSYGAKKVLTGVSFTLTDEMRLGLVGPNGAGKTTLLRIICGELSADSGTAGLSSGESIGYLAQQIQSGSEETVWDSMLGVFGAVFALEEKMRAMESEMENAASCPDAWNRISKEYERTTRAFEDANGYGYKSAIAGVLKGLGLDEELYGQSVNTLSGGQRSRLSLAKLLLLKPSLLLLDEPTNHLDTDAAGWLEEYLRSWSGAVIVVSHDRWFLDQVCTHTGEMHGGAVDIYEGSYSSFVAEKQRKLESAWKAYEQDKREENRQKKIIDQYYAWGRMTGGNNFIKAKSREKLLAKMEFADRPEELKKKMNLKLDATVRSGNEVLKAQGLEMSFGETRIFSGVDITLRRGDRAALIGPNGIGKTTLLRLLSGRLVPAGGVFSFGAGVEPGYYDQLLETLNKHNTVIGEMRDAFPAMDDSEIRNVLASFLFYGDDAFKAVSALSGGEKGRLSLLKLMLGKANLLLLDEPTNHLDMDSREALEDALSSFEGTALFVSHDRYFINKIATRIIEMKEERIELCEGNWTDYLEKIERQKTAQQRTEEDGLTKTAAAKQKRAQAQKERTEKESRERVKQIEQCIAGLEARLADIEKALARPAELSEQRIIELSRGHEETKKRIEEAFDEWEKEQGQGSALS